MRFPIRFFPLLAALALGAPPARAADPAGFTTALRGLERAAAAGSVDSLQLSRAAFAALVADAPEWPRAQYGLALADWRIVPMLGSAQADLARRLCKEGIAACDRAVGADPGFADALALKAGLQGLAIGFAPTAGMTLGPEIAENGGRARGMAPANPRVALLVAINTMHTPAFAGGGPERARPLFDRAVALYDSSATDTSGIAWGHADAWLWSGRCRAALGDWAGARARYRQALAIAPGHAWVRYALLPEAEKHLAAPGTNR